MGRPINEGLTLVTGQPQHGAVLDLLGDELAALLLDERVEELPWSLLRVVAKRLFREAEEFQSVPCVVCPEAASYGLHIQRLQALVVTQVAFRDRVEVRCQYVAHRGAAPRPGRENARSCSGAGCTAMEWGSPAVTASRSLDPRDPVCGRQTTA